MALYRMKKSRLMKARRLTGIKTGITIILLRLRAIRDQIRIREITILHLLRVVMIADRIRIKEVVMIHRGRGMINLKAARE